MSELVWDDPSLVWDSPIVWDQLTTEDAVGFGLDPEEVWVSSIACLSSKRPT